MITNHISSNSSKNTLKKCISDVIGFKVFHLSRVFPFDGFLFISFQQKSEIRKGKYPYQLFTILLEHRFV